MPCPRRARLALSAGVLAALLPGGTAEVGVSSGHHHHHHHAHGHHHGHHHRHQAQVDAAQADATAVAPVQSPVAAAQAPEAAKAPAAAKPAPAAKAPEAVAAAKVAAATPDVKAVVQTSSQASDRLIMEKMQRLESILAAKEKTVQNTHMKRGQIEVNGPLPADFPDRFVMAVSQATGASPQDVKVIGTMQAPGQAGDNVDDVVFEGRANVIEAVQQQAANPESKLATGSLHSFLVAKDDDEAEAYADQVPAAAAPSPPAAPAAAGAPDIDSSEMPFGDLEPFGREDTAQELTDSSIRESDAMVDQLERAEVAEEKRAVFRALTRLRGAAITSYDGIARAQTGNIDEYARKSQWRKLHPVQHLASEESDTSRWAFPVAANS